MPEHIDKKFHEAKIPKHVGLKQGKAQPKVPPKGSSGKFVETGAKS